MSDLQTRPVAPRVPPPDDDSSDIPLWLILVGVGLIVVGLIAAGLVVVKELTATSGPTYPATWDSRIAPYAKIAEKKRGLTFMHPVAVHFLAPAAFEKTVTTDEKKLTSKDRKEIDQFTGLMRALGLIQGKVDLFKAQNDVSGAGILAYYSFGDKTITIRGERVTPAIGATLVHELTHVLQDQHFAIGQRQMQLAKNAEKTGSSAESSVLSAIIEGDAERVENSYVSSLKPQKRKALDAGQQTQGKQVGARMKKNQVPDVLVTLQTAPYTLGETLVQAVAAEGGNAAVDTLFRDAPTEETALLDPLTAGHRKAIKVDTPRLEDGEKKLDSDEFGVLTWYLLLSERVPLRQALAAADGWGGDKYVAFERDGTSCARMNYAGRTPRDTTRMLLALQQWVAAAPGSPAKASLESGLVRFESCDPGTTVQVGKDVSGEAVNLVAVRGYLGINFIKRGATETRAHCVAARLAQAYTVAQLSDPEFARNDPVEQARMQRTTSSCT